MFVDESFDFYISLLSPLRKHSGGWGGISSLLPGRLYGSSRDSVLGILVLDGGDWVGSWDAKSLRNVMSTYLDSLAGWCGLPISVIVGSGDKGKALGMRVPITGALSFFKNLRFRRVIPPNPATVILYWLLGSVSPIRPAMSYRWLFRFWMETVSPVRSGDKACAVRLYLFMRSVLRLDNVFSRFWAVAIHSGCGLYKCECDGIKSRRHLWRRSCALDRGVSILQDCLSCHVIVQKTLVSRAVLYVSSCSLNC